jgi:hypothetical protein
MPPAVSPRGSNVAHCGGLESLLIASVAKWVDTYDLGLAGIALQIPHKRI